MTNSKLSEIAYIFNGYAFKSKKYVSNGIRVIRIANVQDGYISDEQPCFYPADTYDEIEKYILREDDILISLTGNVGRVALLGEDMLPAALNQRVACIRADKAKVNNKYLFYYLRNKEFVKKCIDASKGVAQLNLSSRWVENYVISLPPLEEQERIVAKIEELFSNLDNSIAELTTAKEKLKIYRQAVLQQAFRGELTKEFRLKDGYIDAESFIGLIKSNNKTLKKYEMLEKVTLPEIPKEWKWISVSEISTGAEYGTSSKSQKVGKVPVLRMGNIQNGLFDLSDLVYTSDEVEIEKYLLKKGDVLFNRTNSPDLVGKTAVFKEDFKSIFAGYLIRVNQVSEINPNYLAYYLNSSTAKKYGNKVKTDGVNQSNINSKKLYSYPLPLCCKAEQDEIVYIIDSNLSVCDSIEKTIDQSLQQAEALRQSILKNAFEGKL